MQSRDRGAFSSRIGFIAAAAGSAVGLGNIWGFPYEVAQGGGAAFVIIYLFFCFTLCLPIMMSEVALGRKSRRNPVGAFKVLGFPKWRGVGMLGVVSGVLILSFYNVLAGWSFGYIFEMAASNFDIAHHFDGYTREVGKVGSYGLIFLALTAYVVSKGASGIERIAKLLMPLLLLMIVGIALFGLTLPHASAGLKFYLSPDFTQVTGAVILNAMGQAFFSLSLGMGALITYGSYVHEQENIFTSTALITLADVGIAFLSGLMIFPLVGFLNAGDMSKMAAGPGLIFETLPAVFAAIGGTGGAVLGTLFFLLLCFAALTSTISLLEVPVAYTSDELRVPRTRAVWIVATIVFAAGIPSLLGNGYSDVLTHFIQYPGADGSTNFLGFMLNIANDTFLPLGGCLTVLFVAHVWKRERLSSELLRGAPGFRSSLYYRYVCWALPYLIPTILLLILIMTILRTFTGLPI